MNLLIVFVIMLVLLVSEMGNNHPVEHVWFRFAAILLTTFMVPMLAAFQTVIVTRKLRSEDCDLDKIPSMLKRLTACHSAVWLVASLAIVYSFQWQKIVRGNWGLDQWLLLDEVLIIAPVVLSLIASWAIFFDIQTVFTPASKLKTLKKRIKFVALRVRVYLAIFLVPTLLAIGAKDFIDGQSSSDAMLVTGMIIGLPIMLIAFPFIVMFVWQTRPITDPELRKNVEDIIKQHRLKVASIRIWSTSRQIVNAVVAGVFPYFRVILVSDGLVNQFSSNQLAAIIRHEAGHIRRWHLPLRMFFIILPLAIVMSAEFTGHSAIQILQQLAMQVQ
ncbi:M48 family metalloprotease, partial [bacterium]|nr:M48 family metalloprotease [bacterium]